MRFSLQLELNMPNMRTVIITNNYGHNRHDVSGSYVAYNENIGGVADLMHWYFLDDLKFTAIDSSNDSKCSKWYSNSEEIFSSISLS